MVKIGSIISDILLLLFSWFYFCCCCWCRNLALKLVIFGSLISDNCCCCCCFVVVCDVVLLMLLNCCFCSCSHYCNFPCNCYYFKFSKNWVSNSCDIFVVGAVFVLLFLMTMMMLLFLLFFSSRKPLIKIWLKSGSRKAEKLSLWLWWWVVVSCQNSLLLSWVAVELGLS